MVKKKSISKKYINSNLFSSLGNLFISLFVLTIFNNNNIYIKSLIILPFGYINNTYDFSTPQGYFSYFINNNIYTTIKVNNKDLNFYLTLDRYSTYISEKKLKEIDNPASVIKENDNLYSLEYMGVYRAKFTNSTFTFLTHDNKNIVFNNFCFFMATKMVETSSSFIQSKYLASESEEIGFNVMKGNRVEKVIVEEDEEEEYDKKDPREEEDPYLDEGEYKNKKVEDKYVNKNNGYLIEENSNLVTQLKKNKIISSYAFMIEFDKSDEKKGKITLGGLPHEYDPHHYSEKFFIFKNTNVYNGYANWGLVFDQILYDGLDLNWIKAADISISFPFIQSTETYKDYFDSNFFKNPKYSNFCKEFEDKNYIFKYCDGSVIKNFKKLTFAFINEYYNNKIQQIEFDYNDLFVKSNGNNNLYYFQIIFQNNYFGRWIFGRPLFKKYPTIFDQEKKIFGLYTEVGEYEVKETTEADNQEEKGLSFPWILVIILSIILISFGIVVFIIILKINEKYRKRKANELDDNFDYQSSNEENKLYQ